MMKIQRYEKLKEAEYSKCEGEAGTCIIKRTCSLKARYILGEKKLCKVHAKKEALNLLLESYKEGTEEI